VAPASGPTGGTASLSATLTADGVGATGKTVSFSLNGHSVGSATTNAAGVATIPNASLVGINPGTYPNGVSASFAGDGGIPAANATSVLTVSAAGSAPAPKLSVDPLKGKFGSVAVSRGSKTKKFTITNAGTSALKVSKIKLKGAKGNYRLKAKSCTGVSIAAGASCTFKVVFDPKQAGALGAKLKITSDGGIAKLKLKGKGLS